MKSEMKDRINAVRELQLRISDAQGGLTDYLPFGGSQVKVDDFDISAFLARAEARAVAINSLESHVKQLEGQHG